MTILPLPSVRLPTRRELAQRLAFPLLAVGLVLCVAGYAAVGWLLLRALLSLF